MTERKIVDGEVYEPVINPTFERSYYTTAALCYTITNAKNILQNRGLEVEEFSRGCKLGHSREYLLGNKLW